MIQRAPLWPADKVDANTAAGRVVVWRKEPLPDGDGAADAIDEAWRATRKRYPVPPRRSPPIGIEMGGAELKGAAADYLGVYRLVEGLRINDRPAWRHSVRTDRWLAYDGWDAWMCQPECVLGESKGELQLIAPPESAGAESPERAADGEVWSAAVDGGWLDEPTLRCRPLCTYEDLDAAEWRAQAVAAARDVRARLDGRHPDLGAPELRRAVAELRGLRSHVLAFGHAPWAVWRSAGLCQVSGRPVAQPEEGLQDELGKHHICWESAIDHCDWHAVVAAEVKDEPVDEKKKAAGTPAYIAERLAWARVERAFQKK